MSNFDWTHHAKGYGSEPCATFRKNLVELLGHMATGDDQKGRLIAFHFTSWLNGTMDGDKLT